MLMNELTEYVLFAPAVSIYGGTDEIQKNIVAERHLGLPRDHTPTDGTRR
jgi:alkylation response protein AidB-like acyl-CoA dehydrogenase